MSIDKIVIDKVKEKLKEKNQSEELIQDIINLLNKRDSEKIDIGEKNELLEKILNKIKL